MSGEIVRTNPTITEVTVAGMNELRPEITIEGQLLPVPPEALVELEELRRKRALIGIPGHVLLRIDDAPGKPPEWSVLIGQSVVRKSGKRRNP